MDAILLEGTVRPATGFLLCYVPLATIILGLITFFVWTDRHASRPYLRFNPFVAAGASEQELAARPPAVGETPAGPLSSTAAAGETSVFLGEHGATTTVPKDAVPPPAAPNRPAAFSGAPPAGTPKDLGRVEGVKLPGVDQRPSAPPAPPKNVAPPSAAEIAGSPTAPAAGAQAAKGVAIKHIEFDPPGRDIDGEFVRIENSSAGAINLGGWVLRDAGGKHSYTFPVFTLAAGRAVLLWSKRGTDDSANLYWGNASAIWNNTGDTAILLDAGGNEVARFSYQGKK